MARPKKVRRFNLRRHPNPSGSQSWQVTGTRPDGRRVRRNFKEKADALREMVDIELEIEGNPEPRSALRTLLTAEELTDAESAKQQIGSRRKLSQVVVHYESLRRQAEEAGASLEQAISFFQSHYRPETTEITIFNAKKEFMTTRQDISDTTRANYEHGLSLLPKPDPNRLVHTFTVSDIEAVLSRYRNLQSRRSFRIIFSMFFRWAVRHHYCLENPCDRLDRLPKNMSQIAALSLGEAKRLLHAAMLLQDGASAATIAIGLFAGLRPSEIRDLKAENVLRDRIRVSGGKMRRKLKRSVPVPPVLASWLEEFPFTGLPRGWDYKMKTLKKATKAENWVADILRHTSITFQAERDRDEARTAFNCGTSIEMMNRHYRDLVDDQENIKEYWNLTPAKIREEKCEVNLQPKRRIDWPSKTRLKKLVWQKPLVHAAADIGVSDVALKKRCLKLGIDLPVRGHWARS